MHKPIKRFGMEGEVGDNGNLKLRSQFESLLTDGMREVGYVPMLGLGPYWSFNYKEEADTYEFVLSVYGVYVGRNKACTTEGISVESGKAMARSTPPSKSKASSPPSESK